MSFRVAGKEAIKSQHKQHKLGAVIVKGNRVLSTGHNSIRFSREIGKPTLHAEEAAIVKLLTQRRLHDLFGADLYVTRFTKGGRVGLSLPCSRCMSLIRSVGINRVYYTTDQGTTETLKL